MIINEKRALVYNTPVVWVKPIEGADNIELVGVLGWTCIAKKGEFKPGDTAIYFEIDSKLPVADWSAFMESKHYKVKTMRLGKFNVISQGLALPTDAFGEELSSKIIDAISEGFRNGDNTVDLTEILEVTYSVEEDNKRKANVDPNAKYISMKARHKKFFSNKLVKKMMKYKWFRKFIFIFLGKKKDNPKSFPTNFPYVHKTDEERCENMPWVLGYENSLIVTEKLDGTSCTYILERKKHGKFEFYVSSRNVRQLRPDQECYHESNIYWELALKYNIEEHLREYLEIDPDLDYVCIQGEGVGNVQGNPLKLKENQLFVFNFIRSDIGRLPSTVGREIVATWGMNWVPILDTEYYVPNDMEEFKQFATAKSVVNSDVLREGIVLRDPKTDLSFKNVSREYLLKHNS